ncbi:MAG: ATP-binding cassette domain-containing protein [Myxococcales bacterium]|nr:ATP-binding cassette domain-containing protein [Myxococcales bacterium]
MLEVKDLVVHFPLVRGVLRRRRVGVVRAVDGVSLSLARGEALGLVGESGCGKSTTGRAILQLVRPTSGSVRFDGVELTELDERALRSYRPRMQIVFQDPYASLDPRMSIFDSVAEPLREHRTLDRAALQARVHALLSMVGLDSDAARRYPHQFSGGQRQRIGIARALALEPDVLICDEPTSALDVSVQAQVINLLMSLQRELGLALLFISHDLATVRHIAPRVAVMYLGRIVELAERDTIYSAPAHPYTRALLDAVPLPDPARQRERAAKREALAGEPPSALEPPPGCAFHPRCPIARAHCKTRRPELEGGVACHEARRDQEMSMRPETPAISGGSEAESDP